MKYFAAVCSVAVAALVAYLALPVMGPGVMMFFSIAVLACGFYLGLAAGFVVSTGGALINSYFFMPPIHSLRVAGIGNLSYIILLFVLAFLADRERLAKLRMSQILAVRSDELQAVMALLCPRFPLCSECGKVQTDTGEWTTLFEYLHARYPERQLSFCPDCFKNLHLQVQEEITGDVA